MRLRDEPGVPSYVGVSVFFRQEQVASFMLGAAAVVIVGLVSSRAGMISTKSGHTKGLEFFAYKICTPIMFVNIVVTFEFKANDGKFLVACLLAKLITFAFVWAMTYFFYKTHRAQRSRSTTAAAAAYATVYSADLSFGIPLLRIIYKNDEFNVDEDMLSCTICTVLIFGTLTTYLVHSNTASAEEDDDENRESFCRRLLNFLSLHSANLQVSAVVLGLIIRACVLWASFDVKQLSTVSAMINMIVVTFPVVAMFVTGTAVDVAKNDQWAFFFAMCKVFGVSYLSLCLRKAFGVQIVQHWQRISATFFYGSLPVCASTLGALQVDRTSKELVAGIILWSYVLSLPITFSGIALFDILEHARRAVYYFLYSLDIVSCVAALCICLVMILMGHQYGFGCRAKQLLSICVLCSLACSVLYFITSPLNDRSYCDVLVKHPKDRLANSHFLILDILRDTCTLMSVALQMFLLRDSDDSVHEPFQAGIVAIVCLFAAGIKGWIVFPVIPSDDRMCGLSMDVLTLSYLERYTGFVFYGVLTCFGVYFKMRQLNVLGSTREVAFVEESDRKLARAWTTKVPVDVLTSITDVNLIYIGTRVLKTVAFSIMPDMHIVDWVEVYVKWCDHALLGFTMLVLVLHKEFCSCAKSRIASLRGEDVTSTSDSSDSSS